MGHLAAVAELKRRYTAADFAGEGDEQDALLMALIGLPLAQRLVWQARFCGLVRREVSPGDWEDVPRMRMTAVEAADYLGTTPESVCNMTQRAATYLLGALGRMR